ncbi:AGE family epimerase/isomerase [Maribellus sediminis]|uniref:AGE family epimerase/isomerase n=1 Tax=Maribellus sediminis TaxID=2696285 RepID=UPI00142FB5E2|nr:AGE family epimerase/isomerase [Maribellus sediminis]
MNSNIDFEYLQEELLDELNNILEFWSSQAVDGQFGGFVGRINHFGEVKPQASKGAVLNTRLLWTFSAAYNLIGSEKLSRLADRAFDYLITYFWDKENGGLIWEVDHLGQALNTRKQAYAQGFGIYAFSEYYRATGNAESLEYAKKLYQLLESNYLDKKDGGYIEALDVNWNPMEDMRLSEKDANYPKSMNTHLHILEPYTNLYRVWPNEQLKSSILHLIDVFQQHIIDQETGHFNLFFEMDWTCKSTLVSYGHDIEGAWLIHEAAIETGDEQVIAGAQKSALLLVDSTLKDGRDADGSLFYEKEGNHTDTDKHWWPQAEAMVGAMDAWQISGAEKYLAEVKQVWTFIKENMIDYENGEWFGRVNKNGEPYETEDKAGFWKCPYHNTRAMIEMMNRINAVLN